MASASALPNLYQGVDKQSFGYKLLANFGWKEGQGLVSKRSCLVSEVAAYSLQHMTVHLHWQSSNDTSMLHSHDFIATQGANKQGIKEHVKVKKKQDALGVGAVS